ncbi:MAG: aminoacyl-tRNA hydrolase [Acutalibacteraceae bacterium]
MFIKKDKFAVGAPDYLIVGLGNPGEKYAFTRHNAGFLCLELLADKENAKINKIKFKGVLGEAAIGGHRCILLKPQTFMNNSGESVRAAADFYKIPPEHVLVIFDDISLPCGKLRIRRKGSAGGHNGIKSITAHLGSDAFPRIKLGVGEKPDPQWDLADWVLSNFKKEELTALREASDKACDAVEKIVCGGIEQAMSLYN